MDGMVENGMAQALSRLPYFDPFMLINHSGTCACSRLLQSRYQGVQAIGIEGKLQKEAIKPGPDWTEEFAVTQPGNFRHMHKIVQTMRKTVKGNEKWAPILFEWQLVESLGKKPSDFGQLVLADQALQKFVVIETCVHECIHVKQRSEQRAHLFFCLARYVGFDPKWVRYTVSTLDHKTVKLPEKLLEEGACSPGPWHSSFAQYGFGQVDGTNFQASLSADALQKMDLVIQRSASMAARVAVNWEACGGAAALRRQVLQPSSSERGCAPDKANPPPPIKDMEGHLLRHCANCEADEQSKRLMKCAGCQMKWYCSKRCQKAHWRAGHKLYCKQDTTGQPPAAPMPESMLEHARQEGCLPLQLDMGSLNLR